MDAEELDPVNWAETRTSKIQMFHPVRLVVKVCEFEFGKHLGTQ